MALIFLCLRVIETKTILKEVMFEMQSGQVTGKIGTLVARMFGCRHGELSRPFSHGGRAYRSCLNCGAQRQFNLGNWQMQGDFYYRKPSLAN